MSNITSSVLLAFFACLVSAQAISLETVRVGDDVFFHAENSFPEAKENHTYLNASSGCAQMFNGANLSDALSRNWQTFRYGLATYDGEFHGLIPDDLSAFTCVGTSNNATYWLVNCSRTFTFAGRTATLQFAHWQRAGDDHVNETWRLTLDRAYTAESDIYLVEALTKISYLDHLQVQNSSAMTGHPLSTNWHWVNASAIAIMNYGDAKGWDYRLNISQTNRGNAVLVKDGVAYIGIDIGRTIPAGTHDLSMLKIDAENCQISCDPGDEIVPSISYNESRPGYAPYYRTVTAYMEDNYNSCFYGGCRTEGRATNYYNYSGNPLYGLNRINTTMTPAGGSWLQCKYDAFDDYCVDDAWALCPIYTYCAFNLTVQGNYTAIRGVVPSWGHYDAWYFNRDLIVSNAWAGNKDETNPQLEIPFANDSILQVLTTNGSLEYANLSVNAIAHGGGLINVTGVTYNFTDTTRYIFNAVDNETALIPLNATVQNGEYYQVCIMANQTNYYQFTDLLDRPTGTRGSNWTSKETSGTKPHCHIFGVEIVPETTNTSQVTPLNGTELAPQEITFTCNASTDTELQNVSLYISNSAGDVTEYNTTDLQGFGLKNVQLEWYNYLPPDAYNWTCEACSYWTCANSTENWTLTIRPENTGPSITALNFLNYSQQGFLVNFSGFETDDNALSTCIFSFNITGEFANESPILISGTSSSCLQNKSFPFPGAYGVRLWVNDSYNIFGMEEAIVLITPSGPHLTDYAPIGITIAGGALAYWFYRRRR